MRILFDIIKIISRVANGVLPVLWIVSYWMFMKKNKLEKLCGITSLALIMIGIIECILMAFGYQ